MGGPAQVLEYLSRYTHRTAIGNERIKAVTQQEVVFPVRADGNGGKRTMCLEWPEFVQRFRRHILPTGLKRIRHYGVLASTCKGERLVLARAALQMPAPNAQAAASAVEFLRRVARVESQQCPYCKAERLRVVESMRGQARLPEPGKTVLPQGRAPP